jgi:hypothetical protein
MKLECVHTDAAAIKTFLNKKGEETTNAHAAQTITKTCGRADGCGGGTTIARSLTRVGSVSCCVCHSPCTLKSYEAAVGISTPSALRACGDAPSTSIAGLACAQLHNLLQFIYESPGEKERDTREPAETSTTEMDG